MLWKIPAWQPIPIGWGVWVRRQSGRRRLRTGSHYQNPYYSGVAVFSFLLKLALPRRWCCFCLGYLML